MRNTRAVGRVGSSMTIASGWLIRAAGAGPDATTTTPVHKLGPEGAPGDHDIYFNSFCNIVHCAEAQWRRENAKRRIAFSVSASLCLSAS